MSCAESATIRSGLLALGLTAAMLAASLPLRAAAQDSSVYAVEVGDVTAKVGQPAVMHATLKLHDGYRILRTYNNRVSKLSSADNGVVFEQEMVKAELKDDALVFAIPLHATKPGTHPINGVFRVGYVEGASEMDMVSVKLIANVTGTE